MAGLRVFILLFTALTFAGCASAPDRGAEPASELMTRYRAYAEALATGNFEAASRYVPASKRHTADYSRLSVLSPLSDLRFKKEWFDGEEAILIVTGKSEGNDATGRIKMVRENGEWQVLSEMWNLGGGSEFLEQRDPPRTPAQKEAIRKLEERGFPMPSGDFLVMSAHQGNLETVKLFLEAGFSIESRGQGSTALISAVRSERADVAMFLIEQGADINATDDISVTALMYAVNECSMTEVVMALLAIGARLDIKSDGGTSALDLAEMGNCPRNAELVRAAAR